MTELPCVKPVIKELDKIVFIPVIPPSQNDFHGRHWASYRKKFYKRWEWNLIAVGYGKNCGGLRPIDFIHVRKNSHGFYDLANFIGGLKPIVDIIKKRGWMKDDKPKYFLGGYYQMTLRETSMKEEGLIIRIYKEVL